MGDSTILAMGGFPAERMVEHLLSLARGRRVLFDCTASPQYDRPLDWPAEMRVLSFYPWPPENLRELALAHDVILIGGGNTANMLAVWRVQGFDRILREAWESGVLLTGWSAGANCWFEAGVTDSFGPQLAGICDGLGFLRGSACPHYDGEELRRPVYRRLVSEEGFPPGIAIDDGVGVLYRGTELAEVLSCRDGATAYRIGPDGEARLPATPLRG